VIAVKITAREAGTAILIVVTAILFVVCAWVLANSL
jgi:hypothetical protein